MTRAEKHARSG